MIRFLVGVHAHACMSEASNSVQLLQVELFEPFQGDLLWLRLRPISGDSCLEIEAVITLRDEPPSHMSRMVTDFAYSPVLVYSYCNNVTTY